MDFTVWINVTAPYANGLGRRTVWRGRARVDAASTEQALRSQSFESTGDVYIHGLYQAICILGGGWELHINCPDPNSGYCRACGSPEGHAASYCRDCCPKPSHADNVRTEELKPRYRQATKPQARSGKLRTMNVRDMAKPKKSSRRVKKLSDSGQMDLEAMILQLKNQFS